MNHQCTTDSDLDELLGHDSATGYCYGPICEAMRSDEALVLEESTYLSALVRAKLQIFLAGVFIPETGEHIKARSGFRLIFG